MDHDDSPALIKSRGRPRKDAKRQVVQTLLDTTERLLRDHSHVELTERDIAMAAGVDVAMINYYFDSKNGLLFDVLSRCIDEVFNQMDSLEAINPALQDVTRHFIRTLINAFYAKPWIVKVMLIELVKTNSLIKDNFSKRYGPNGGAQMRIKRTLERFVECGIYDARIKSELVVQGLFFILVAPFALAPITGNLSAEFDELKSDIWVDYISDLFDRQLRLKSPKE